MINEYNISFTPTKTERTKAEKESIYEFLDYCEEEINKHNTEDVLSFCRLNIRFIHRKNKTNKDAKTIKDFLFSDIKKLATRKSVYYWFENKEERLAAIKKLKNLN